MSEDKVTEEVAPEVVEETEEKPAPKKRRRRKKKEEPKLLEAAPEAATFEAKLEDEVVEPVEIVAPEEPAKEEVAEAPAPAPKKQRLQVESQTKVKFEQVKSEKPAHIHKYLGRSFKY